MKRLYLLVLLSILISNFTFSQEEKNNITKKETLTRCHEIKLNGLFLILGAFEPSYEYILNEDSSLGISIFLPIGNDVKNDIRYSIAPYYRYFFGNKRNATGFFAEAFGMLNETNRQIDLFNILEDNFKTDFAFGFGFGGKWVNSRGFMFELSMGIGRNLFNNDDSDYEIVGRGGITLGYRF